MIHSDLLVSLVAALVAAFCGGFIAAQLRLPPIVGYLVAGIAIGPATPGFEADADIAAELAEIGVVLLMFGVGIHFSLRDLWAVRSVAVPGAVGQITVTCALGTALAYYVFGWTFGESLVMALAISVASTVVLLRALEDRGLLDSVQGHAAIGWLIVEDLFTVLVLVLLPALAGPLGGEDAGGNGALLELGEALLKAGAFLAVMLVAGRRIIPWLLVTVARTASRELFTLAVLAIALGVAAGSAELFGVSLALGAFLAGVIISESDLSHQAAADALPMRDAFAVLFFVSVGMLFDPGVIDDSYAEILAILAIIVIGKAAVAFGIVAAVGHSPRVGLTVAAGLAQIGEFSFILMTVGGDLAIVPEEQTDIVLATALASIMLNPLLFAAIDAIEDWLRVRAPGLGQRGSLAAFEQAKAEPMRNHAVICGYGRVGRVVAQSLAQRNFRYIVVEGNRRTVEALRAKGVPVVYGDAGHHLILGQANLETARVLVVTVPDPPVVRRIVAYAREVAPRLDIIARTHSAPELEVLTEQGVGEAVYGEWEVALELTRRALYRFGLSSQEALAMVQRQRAQGPPRGLEDLI